VGVSASNQHTARSEKSQTDGSSSKGYAEDMVKRKARRVMPCTITYEEMLLLHNYNQLNKLETRSYYLAIRCYLLTGNIRLLWAFYRRSIAFVQKIQVA